MGINIDMFFFVSVKLGSLYSGGKDSTYAILRAKEMGHQISCLITMHPAAEDSPLFHYPNTQITEYLAEAMSIPIVRCSISGRSKEDESRALVEAISSAKSSYQIEGIVYGGLSSNFQMRAVEQACSRLNLVPFAPAWGSDPAVYMNTLLDRGFKIMIVGVSAMGLGKELLGSIVDGQALQSLTALSRKYGFNLNFEGGEAETLVVDCPLFEKRLEVRRSTKHWDGQKGIFEIQEAALVEK